MIEQSPSIALYDWVTIIKTKKTGGVTDIRVHSDGTKEYFVKYFRGKRWFKESEVVLHTKH